MSHEDFGLRLKQFRRYQKLTQEDISKLLNISRQAYSNYEQGRCLPPPNTLADLSCILNTNLFIYFIKSSSYSHPHSSKCPNITEEESKLLIDLYSHLSIKSRTQVINYLLQNNRK